MKMNSGVLSSKLLRNAGWMLAGQGLGLVVQAAYFILIARSLGAQQYGAFIAIVSILGLIGPLGTGGTGNLLIRDVSRNPGSFACAWGNLLIMTLGLGALVSMLAVAIARAVLPGTIPLVAILGVAGGDLMWRVVSATGKAFQAVEELRLTASTTLSFNVLRVVGGALLITVCNHPTASHWATVYLITSGLSALYWVQTVTRRLGRPSWLFTLTARDLKEGLYFSISDSATGVYNNIDKTIMSRLSTLEATGIYSAAYRLVDVAFIPIRSVLYAAYARFFKKGANGLSSTVPYARKMQWRALIYAVGIITMIGVASPFVPAVLGRQYLETTNALLWLAPLTLIRCFHYFAGDALTGSDHNGTRVAIETSVGILNIGLNLWLIPVYSWRGAALASLLCDGSLAIGHYIAIYCISRRACSSLPLVGDTVQA